MSINSFTKKNLDFCLKELGKEYKKQSGSKMPAEIILIGGASILANYNFRDVTYDVDAVILASSAMKEAAKRVSETLGLPSGWLNMDFKRTNSYSDKLAEVSIHYKSFTNILTVRTVTAEYLVAMKLKSGRRYKNDLSDVAGVLWEHEKNGKPITREAIDKAVTVLYGGWDSIEPVSKELIQTAFENGDYEKLYQDSRVNEKLSKEILLDFEKDNPGELKGENIGVIIEMAKKRLSEK